MKNAEHLPPAYAEHLAVLRRIEKKLDAVLNAPQRDEASTIRRGAAAGAFAGAATATAITCIKQMNGIA